MKCDQAFERLTEAQFTDDADLTRHLRECPRCRAMQQTLSPALKWMRESRHDVTEQDSPWHQPSAALLTEESVAVAVDIAQRLPRAGRNAVMRQALGFALVATFGIAFGVLVLGQHKEESPKAVLSASPLPKTMCLWTQRDGESPRQSAASVVDSCIACHVPAMIRN
ncbi:MAG TPA: hypothetical protein VFG20_01230 [Planctomycetaceae bacterium]|nr:hypothetical protein [Planctomycetaceae bacterium]